MRAGELAARGRRCPYAKYVWTRWPLRDNFSLKQRQLMLAAIRWPNQERIVAARQTSKPLLYSLIASMLISAIALAADNAPAGPAEPSKEMRAKMATVHEQMAACLRSDKSFSDCRSEMMKECQQLMGERGCPMMGMGSHNPMMMRGPSSAAPKDN